MIHIENDPTFLPPSLSSGRYLYAYRHLVFGPPVTCCRWPIADKMGGALSHFFQSGHALLSSGHNRTVSDQVGTNIESKIFARPPCSVANWHIA